MSLTTDLQKHLVATVKRHSAIIGSTVSIATETNEIVLTFDDGPSHPITEQISDILLQAGATATFFVLMTRVGSNHRTLEMLVEQGHEIALHGLDHRRLTKRSYSSIVTDLRRCKDDLEDMTGSSVRWFRPPYGAQGARSWLAIRSAGLEPVMWNRSTRDSSDIADALRMTAATDRAAPGDILLAHDGFASNQDGAHDGPAPNVDRPDLIRRVLAEYRGRGLVGRSIGDALERGTAVRRAWFSSVL